jgi:hypothetical protein
MLLVRRRYIGDGMCEDIAIHNTARVPATVAVMLTADADFAGLFEVKAGLAQPAAAVQVAATGSALTFEARRGERRHGLVIHGDGDPAAGLRALSWRAVVPARGERLVSVEAVPVHDGVPMRLHHPRGVTAAQVAWRRRGRSFRRTAAPRHSLRHRTSPAACRCLRRTAPGRHSAGTAQHVHDGLHRRWLKREETPVRKKITVLNLRDALSTALVAAHVAGLASWPPGLNVNKMLAAGLDGALGWPGDPAFAALLEEPGAP